MKKTLLLATVLFLTAHIAQAQVDPSSCAQYNHNPPLVYDPATQKCVVPAGTPSTSGQDTGSNTTENSQNSPSAADQTTSNQTQASGQPSTSNTDTGNAGGTGTITSGTDSSASTQTSTYSPVTGGTSNTTSSGKLTYTPLEPLPGDKNNNGTYNSLSAYLTLMFNILLSIGAMIAVVTLVLAGITYMVSEVVDRKAAARRRINASFIGLGLLLTSYLILYTINPNLVKLCILNLDQQCGGGANGIAAGGNAVTPNTPNPTPAPSVLAAQEASCKKGGDLCAFDPTPGQPGVFQCDCAGL